MNVRKLCKSFWIISLSASDLTESLKGVYDIERLASRVSFGKSNPKDLLQLATTLGSVPRIRAILEGMEQPALAYLIEQLDAIPELEISLVQPLLLRLPT